MKQFPSHDIHFSSSLLLLLSDSISLSAFLVILTHPSFCHGREILSSPPAGIFFPWDSVISLSPFQFQFQCPPLAPELNNIGKASKAPLLPPSPLFFALHPILWLYLDFKFIYLFFLHFQFQFREAQQESDSHPVSPKFSALQLQVILYLCVLSLSFFL